MNQFPPPTSPPAPGGEPTDPNQPEPASTPTSSRRRLALAAVAATALGVAGVAVGSQLAAADDEVPTDEPTTERPDDADDDADDESDEEQPDDEVDSDEAPENDIDAPSDDETAADRPDFDELFDFDELEEAFEEFDACLSDKLPDLQDGGWIDVEVDGNELPDLGDFDGDWETAFEDLVGGSVTVFSPGAEDDLTFLDFGDGDGSITITQSDGEIEITTDGDVETLDADIPFDIGEFDLGEFDLGEFDLGEFDLGELDLDELPGIEIESDPEFDAAFEACSALLPDDGIFEMVGDVMDVFGHDDD